MSDRSIARLLAPLALAACALAVVIVIASSGSGDESASRSKPAATRTKRSRPATAPAARPTTTAATSPPGSSVYVVRSGDVLSAIAERTGVTVARIQALNPGLDPRALIAGQRIKLQP